MGTDLSKQMEQAIKKIAKVLEEQNIDTPAAQETNIFRILRVDQHEIRHGAFLEFLLDPERNPELADCFLRSWLEEIASELALEDEQVEKIIDGDYEIVNHIAGANRYSEIPFNNKASSNRIDHALEVQLKGTRRVLVFEYKHNGVMQNDLKAYRAFVENEYRESRGRAKIYCFILELSHKSHNDSCEEGWFFISRDTLINAVTRTLDEARRKDMQATRLYLEHYLAILQPDPDGLELLVKYRAELWNLWNPEVARFDPEAKYFNEILNAHISSEEHRDLLNSFDYHMLVDWAVSEAVNSIRGLSARVNSGWVRILREGIPKNLYLFTYLHEEESGELYLATKLRSWQDTKIPAKKSEEQYHLLCEALSGHSQIGEWFSSLTRPEEVRFAILVKEDEGGAQVKAKRNHPINCKTPFDLSVTWLWPINQHKLQQIATDTDKPQIFHNWLDDLKAWAADLSKLSQS